MCGHLYSGDGGNAVTSLKAPGAPAQSLSSMGVAMGFTVRTVVESDAEAIVSLLNPIIDEGTHTIMVEPITVDDQVDFIIRFPDRGVYHLAISDDGKVLGIQDVQPIASDTTALNHVGQISTFVSLDDQRSGVGRAMSRATFRAAKAKGFLKLCASIRVDNRTAISFYQSQGFQIIGTARRHALIDGKYLDEVLAERFLE